MTTTMRWYKLVRDGEKIKVWQAGSVPMIWGKADYRLYEYTPELGAGKHSWVQIGGDF